MDLKLGLYDIKNVKRFSHEGDEYATFELIKEPQRRGYHIKNHSAYSTTFDRRGIRDNFYNFFNKLPNQKAYVTKLRPKTLTGFLFKHPKIFNFINTILFFCKNISYFYSSTLVAVFMIAAGLSTSFSFAVISTIVYALLSIAGFKFFSSFFKSKFEHLLLSFDKKNHIEEYYNLYDSSDVYNRNSSLSYSMAEIHRCMKNASMNTPHYGEFSPETIVSLWNASKEYIKKDEKIKKYDEILQKLDTGSPVYEYLQTKRNSLLEERNYYLNLTRDNDDSTRKVLQDMLNDDMDNFHEKENRVLDRIHRQQQETLSQEALKMLMED